MIEEIDARIPPASVALLRRKLEDAFAVTATRGVSFAKRKEVKAGINFQKKYYWARATAVSWGGLEYHALARAEFGDA